VDGPALSPRLAFHDPPGFSVSQHKTLADHGTRLPRSAGTYPMITEGFRCWGVASHAKRLTSPSATTASWSLS